MTLKVFEAFAGIGTQRRALRNLDIDHEVVAISEIDKFAIKSYEAIHGKTLNLGDITEIKTEDIPDCDLFTYSFPCQDISVAGERKGLAKGSGTRSSLLWECQRIIESKKPKYLLMENVKALIFKKNRPHFEEWLKTLSDLGYTNYWSVLNAKHYGIPQNRERVFCISILGDHDPYVFPKPFETTPNLNSVLETNVEDRYFLKQEIQDRFLADPKFKNDIKTLGTTRPFAKIGQRDVVYSTDGTIGTLTATCYKQPPQIGVQFIGGSRGRNPNNPSDRTSGTETQQRLEINKDGVSNTVTTVQKDNYVVESDPVALGTIYSGASKNFTRGYMKGLSRTIKSSTYDTSVIFDNLKIRKLTPLECWRLMGISDEDFYKAKSVNSNTQLYKQAGNAIVVDVLEEIFKQLFLKE